LPPKLVNENKGDESISLIVSEGRESPCNIKDSGIEDTIKLPEAKTGEKKKLKLKNVVLSACNFSNNLS